MNDKDKPTQIAFNFGPVNGNVEKQHIHVAPQPHTQDSRGAAEGGGNGSAQEPSAPHNAAETREKSGGSSLTIGQLIILFESVLNISLDSSETNQNALASLISAVSGHKSESIRQKIREGVDYDKPQVKNDAKKIVALLEKLKPDISERLRNNLE